MQFCRPASGDKMWNLMSGSGSLASSLLFICLWTRFTLRTTPRDGMRWTRSVLKVKKRKQGPGRLWTWFYQNDDDFRLKGYGVKNNSISGTCRYPNLVSPEQIGDIILLVLRSKYFWWSEVFWDMKMCMSKAHHTRRHDGAEWEFEVGLL
jgi:hypothetical protein